MTTSASPSPFTGREEKRFEVKKRNRDVVRDNEEEEGRKNIKDKIRMVRMVTGQGRSADLEKEKREDRRSRLNASSPVSIILIISD